MRAGPDRPVRPLGAIALLVGALALAGCATTDAAGAGAESSAPETDAMTAEPMDDATESPEASDAEAEPMDDAAAPAEGAYLDYEDGAKNGPGYQRYDLDEQGPFIGVTIEL